jgi:hypothetical protein
VETDHPTPNAGSSQRFATLTPVRAPESTDLVALDIFARAEVGRTFEIVGTIFTLCGLAMAVQKRAVILLGWRAEPFRRRSAHARSGTSHIAQDQSTDSRTRDRQG